MPFNKGIQNCPIQILIDSKIQGVVKGNNKEKSVNKSFVLLNRF